jgi:ribonucleotide reductase alpha subunit
MPRKRQLRPDAEIAVYRTAEPVLVNGGQTVKSLSAAFLADLEDDWRQHGKQIFSETSILRRTSAGWSPYRRSSDGGRRGW